MTTTMDAWALISTRLRTPCASVQNRKSTVCDGPLSLARCIPVPVKSGKVKYWEPSYRHD